MHKRGKYVDALRTVKYCNIPFWRDPGSWSLSQCSVWGVKVKLRRGRERGHPPIRQQDVERGAGTGEERERVRIRPVSSHR